jgi:2-methylcitrate dehydratase PrpD
MPVSTPVSNIRPEPDKILVELANYAAHYVPNSREAIDTARYNLLDTLGCGLLALHYPECAKHLGPIVPGATLNNGARVPGTDWQLDPVHAAFHRRHDPLARLQRQLARRRIAIPR